MSEQTNPIISFKNFSFQYRAQKKPTLHDINLDIYPGERVLIAGPSGSGKSTLAACINGLNPFSNPGECTGSLTVDGVDAPNSSIFELSAHVGTVLQDPDGQFIGLTVGEDIAFALENSCVPQKEMHEITRHAAELVGIEKRLDHAPHELSGGQKQRVSLAGVMVDQVKILMFDEPLASLDPATGKLVEGDICAQAEQCCKNVVALLESQGLTTANVVKTTVFIADMNDFPKGNEVYKKYFCEPFPARSCVAIKSLPLGAQVEVEAIAAL